MRRAGSNDDVDGSVGDGQLFDTRADQPRVAAALTANAISADFRGTTVRLSFHAYNGADDAEAAVRAPV